MHKHYLSSMFCCIILGVCGWGAAGGLHSTTWATEIGEEIIPIQFFELEDEQAATEMLEIFELPGESVGDERIPVLPLTDDAARENNQHISEPPLLEVSSRAADGLRIQDFGFDEMPTEKSSGNWFSSGCWYGSAESVWYDRSRNYRTTLGREPSTSTGPVLDYTTLAQPFDMAAGARVTLGRSIGRDYLDRDRYLEFVYYGGMNWNGVDGWNSLTAVPTLITPLAIAAPGFNFANTFNTSISSNFNSMEWNYKLKRRLGRDQMVMSPNGNWSRHAERGFLAGLIVGTRVTSVNEDFSFISRRNGVSPSVFGGNYDISTQNWLLGLTLGSELVSQNEFYYWGLRGRASPSLSFAANQQSIVGVNTTGFPPPAVPAAPTTDNRTSAANQVGPGFVGDLSLFGGWNITPNFSLKAGYDFLWVAGIATATRQFNLDNRRQNPIDGGGQVFYNGVTFGCEGSW